MQTMLKPQAVPSLMNPSICYEEEEKFLYTGFFGWNTGIGNIPEEAPRSLWSCMPDGKGSGHWNGTIGFDSSIWKSLTRTSTALMAFRPKTAVVLSGTTQSHIFPLRRICRDGPCSLTWDINRFQLLVPKTLVSVIARRPLGLEGGG